MPRKPRATKSAQAAELPAPQISSAAAKLKRQYLEEYAKCGVRRTAARVVGIDVGDPDHWAREDPAFAVAMREAQRDAAQVLEDCAVRRATVGIPKPIYQRGTLVGYERIYSDYLLAMLLRAHKPEIYGSLNPAQRAAIEAPSASSPREGLTKETIDILREQILGIKKL
jgi:hypothetical protein